MRKPGCDCENFACFILRKPVHSPESTSHIFSTLWFSVYFRLVKAVKAVKDHITHHAHYHNLQHCQHAKCRLIQRCTAHRTLSLYPSREFNRSLRHEQPPLISPSFLVPHRRHNQHCQCYNIPRARSHRVRSARNSSLCSRFRRRAATRPEKIQRPTT